MPDQAIHIYVEFEPRNEQAIRDSLSSAPAEVVSEFCLLYPETKDGLLALEKLAPFLPTVGSLLTMAISVVLAGGDAVSRSICGEP